MQVLYIFASSIWPEAISLLYIPNDQSFMKKTYTLRIAFLWLLCCLPFLNTYAQTLSILDKNTLQPLPNAEILVGQTNRLVSDNKGQAIVKIGDNESLSIRLVGYRTLSFTLAELQKQNYQVLLSEKSFDLNEVIVSASRFEERQRDVPQQVQVLREKDLKFMSQPTSAEVLQQSGNVLVQKSQLGGGSPIIRGFEANKVLLVIDGVRMNNAIFRGGHLQNVVRIDNSMLEKAEIVFGPGSTVYGSDALGGVVHFHTKNPLLNVTKANAYLRYGSAATEKTGHVDINLGGSQLASLTSLTYSDFGDLRQGDNRSSDFPSFGKQLYYVVRENDKDVVKTNDDPNVQKFSGYQQLDLLQKFRYQASEKVGHVLNIQYSKSSDVPRYDRLTELASNLPRFAQWYYGPEKRVLVSYQLQLSKGKFYDDARITAAWQNLEESRHDRRLNNNNINHRLEKVKVWSLNADFQKKKGTDELRYGLEAVYNDVNSTATVENVSTKVSSAQSTRYPDGGSQMSSVAAYFTHTKEFSDKFVLNDGLRLTHTDLKAKFIEKTFFPFPFNETKQNSTALNGSLGMIYLPGQDWRFSLTGATGFRAPNVDDLAKVFESAAGNLIIPNPDLKPERTLNFDFGLSKVIANTVRFEATTYYTRLYNAITTQKTTFNGQSSVLYNGKQSTVVQSANVNKAYVWGYSLQLQADLSETWSLSASYNYTKARIKTDSTDYPLDHIPPVFGKISAKLNLKKFKGELFMLFNGAKTLKNFNLLGEDNFQYATTTGMPAWQTVNVRTSYQICSYLQAQLALENIFDTNYRVFASGLSSPGRNFVVTLRASL